MSHEYSDMQAGAQHTPCKTAGQVAIDGSSVNVVKVKGKASKKAGKEQRQWTKSQGNTVRQ